MKNIYSLTHKQQIAFNNLKKAFKQCEKSGLVFVNVNDRITVYNSAFVEGSTDNKTEGDIPNDMVNINRFNAPINAWIDCDAYLKLTAEGLKLLNQ